MSKILIFGAGNIGRAFIGQVFSRNGYEVVFADIQEQIILGLNERKSYPLAIKRDRMDDEIIMINHVRAVSVLDSKSVIREFVEADIIASSVGKNAITHIAPLIAKGIMERINQSAGPVDFILAENIHNGQDFLIKELEPFLPDGIQIKKELGIVQTSIGKMVPIVTASDRKKDPLMVASEEYNELIVDALAFINPIPDIPEILGVTPIEAYADRKIYLHNLGHAVAAYWGHFLFPDRQYIAEVLEDVHVLNIVRMAMEESALALNKIYPRILDAESLSEHIEDLLVRFRNRSLGDTVYRIGRDLKRKLNREDRILGAIRNCEIHNISWTHIGDSFLRALQFKACDEEGNPFSEDLEFLQEYSDDFMKIMKLCGMKEEDPIDMIIIEKLMHSRVMPKMI